MNDQKYNELKCDICQSVYLYRELSNGAQRTVKMNKAAAFVSAKKKNDLFIFAG